MPGVETQGPSIAPGERRELAVLVAVAFVVRYGLFALRGDYLDWDEALYLLMSRSLLAGDGLSVNGLPHIALGPLVPFLTAGLSKLGGVSPLGAQRLLASLAGAALLVPVWYLFRVAADRRIARVGALLLVGWTALIDVGPRFGPMWRHVYAGSEPFYLAALFGAFALVEFGLRRRGMAGALAAVGAGALLALAYLARQEAVVIGGLYALFRSALALQDGSRWREVLGSLAIVGAAFLIIAGPYLIHLRQVSGGWTLSGNLGPTGATAGLYQEVVRDDSKIAPYLEAWWALSPDHQRLVNPYWGVDGSSSLGEQLEEYQAALAARWAPGSSAARRWLGGAWAYALALWWLGLPLFLPLAAAGALWVRKGSGTRFPAFVLAAIAGSLLVSWRVYVLPRFLLVLVPALAFWAAWGVSMVARLNWPRRLGDAQRAIVFVTLAAGLGLAALRALGSEARMVRETGSQDRAAAEILGEAIDEEAAVLSWHPRLAYWGGWDWRALPVARLDAVAHYAAHRGVTMLFLSKGAYSPLALQADYVVILVDPNLAMTYRALETGSPEHPHPPATLLPTQSVAGLPTGRIVLDASPEAERTGER